MKSKVSYRIRKLRESKDLKQGNIAEELNISESAYSKIERGVTDPSIGRLEQIAKILGVEVTYFFQDTSQALKMEDGVKLYGFATKSDVDDLNSVIKQLRNEINGIKRDIAAMRAGAGKRKK